MLQDYVVALEARTGHVLNVWEGGRFRSYDVDRVEQYKVAMADGPDDACRRALAIRAQFLQARARLDARDATKGD